jgi:hypothetical protein
MGAPAAGALRGAISSAHRRDRKRRGAIHRPAANLRTVTETGQYYVYLFA